MTLSFSTSDIGKTRHFFGLVLCALVLQTADAAISGLCTTFTNAGGTVSLQEGVNTNLTITAWDAACEAPACIAANTSCSAACSGCVAWTGAVFAQLAAEGVNATWVDGVTCTIGNYSNGGMWPAQCLAMNSFAGWPGYSLVLTVMDANNMTLGTKRAAISFVAGDVVITKCMAMFQNDTTKAWIGYDNALLIHLKDAWNNSVGASTGRTGIPVIDFNVSITWNPDDGSKVSLGTVVTVDTKGDMGYYTANIIPLKTGNYLAKISVNSTMIANSPLAFLAVKGKKSSANFLRPLIFGTGVRGFTFLAIYMGLVSAMAGNLM